MQVPVVGGEEVDDSPLHHRAEDDLAVGLAAARQAHLVGIDGHGKVALDDVGVGEAVRELDVKVIRPRGVGEVEVARPGGVAKRRVRLPRGGVLRRVVAREGVVVGDAEPRGRGHPDFARVALGP